MYAGKLHTSQYTNADQLRAERTKVTGKHTIRAFTSMVAVGVAEWCGSGIAHADNDHEQKACALMNDYATPMHLGYGESTLQYAYAVLSTEMPPADAAHVLLAATRDDCPNHAADVPPGWQ